MNINRCRGFKWRGQYCAFLRMTAGKDGKPDESTARCWLRGTPRDDFRNIPEHNADGGVVYQNPLNSQPFNFGPNVIWGSLRPNDAGWYYDPFVTAANKNMDIRPEDFNMNPEYTIKEINEPIITAKSESDSVMLTPYGRGIGTMLASAGWADQDVKGLDRIDRCQSYLYGTYNSYRGMVIPKCAKDYTGDIPGWVNYTFIPSRNRDYAFYVVNATTQEIAAHCIKWFGRTPLAAGIMQILAAIKEGVYIPLRDALENNGVDEKTRTGFMRETNTRSNNIHRDINLWKFYLYYRYVRTLPNNIVLKANIINYLLNDPVLATMNINEPDITFSNGKSTFSPRKRYWWLLEIIRDALRDKHRPLINKSVLPPWLIAMMKAKVQKEDDKEKNPLVIPLIRILQESGEEFKPDLESNEWKRRVKIFSMIVIAGQRWSTPEIKCAWIEFCKAYQSKSPMRFWDWAEDVRVANSTQLSRLIPEEFSITDSRAFAYHLKYAIRNKDSFEVNEPYLQERWHQITPKARRTSEEGVVKGNPEDMAWNELEKIFVKTGKQGTRILQRFRAHLAQLDPKTAALILRDSTILIEEYRSEIEEEFPMGTSIDGDDLGREKSTRIVDIDGNEETFGEEEGTWDQE